MKRSAIKSDHREKDFHTVYKSDNPTYYGVICCDNCGYTVFEKDFKKITPYETGVIKDRITPSWGKKNFGGVRTVEDAIMVHKIALANYVMLKRPASVIGQVYLRLTWYYREVKNTDQEMAHMQKCVDTFIQAFETEYFEERPEREIEMLYLLGELNRRLGSYNDAIKWFQKTTQHPFIKQRRLFENYARDQWALASEEYKKTT